MTPIHAVKRQVLSAFPSIVSGELQRCILIRNCQWWVPAEIQVS